MYLVIFNVQSNESIRDAVIGVTQVEGLKLDTFVRRLCESIGPRALTTQILGEPNEDVPPERLKEILGKPLYSDAVLYPIGEDLTVGYEGAISAPCSDVEKLQLRLF
tara:strand:- start:11675 stop:11995 length:321 start_codon:yes stop_codon:yes gene_type:complete